MKYYFFCPNCKHEDTVASLPIGTVGIGTVGNIRGGYGVPIHHFECPMCSNLDAGYMRLNIGKMSELPEDEQTDIQ